MLLGCCSVRPTSSPCWPGHLLPFRRFFLFFCRNSTSSSSTPDSLTLYKQAFSNRMSLAGIKPHHKIALGVSGGPDSMALCVLTAGWKAADGLFGKTHDGLLGIVVDHNLRPESADEAKLVKDRVSNMGIKCEIKRCDWSGGKPKPGHLQEAAREMRYQIFQDVCIEHQIGVLLIAHHADDQAELFILRLSRNSGVIGLAGMAFVSQLFPTHSNYSSEQIHNGILLVRPMLDFSKDDMYQICQGGHQEWVEDPTNQSPLFARNRLRISLRSVSSSSFRSEVQSLIAACRLTRSFVENVCHRMIQHSVTIVNHGYAVIDLEKLEPSNVEDLCLSKFLAMILQFISQRHRPVRGSVSHLLLDYVRNFPCKTSLAAAGCYLCAAPQSRGTKILVCCSPDSSVPSGISSSYKYLIGEQSSLPQERDQTIMESKLYCNQLAPDASTVHFLHTKSSEDFLIEAKKLKLIGESGFININNLQMEERKNFNMKAEVKPNSEWEYKIKSSGASQIALNHGEACHFMGRFLVTWKIQKNVTKDELSSISDDFNKVSEGNQDCQFCTIDQEKPIAIRQMVDDDWLYLAEVSKSQMLKDCQDHSDPLACRLKQNTKRKVQCSNYMQLSAQKALQALKSIPAAGRRALPVLVDSHDLPLSIPSICFRCCPCLSAVAVFRPRVPLGGGHSSFC